MIAVVEFLRRAWPYLLALAIVLGSLYGAYHHGASVTQAAWDKQVSDDKAVAEKARADAEQAARAEEQRRLAAAQQVQAHAIQELDKARADADLATAGASQLRDQLAKLQTRLGGSATDSTLATRSASATRAAMVLSDLLERANQRATVLAKTADQARIRGMTCEAHSDSLTKK